MPAVYAAGKANLDNPPKEFTDLAIRMAKGSVGYFSRDRRALGEGGRRRATRPCWKEFETGERQVVAATKDFAAWLEKDLLPRSKGSYAIGAANFLAKLKYDEMVELPLAELLANGEAQLAKDYAAFVETAKKIDPSKTPAEVMKSLSDEHPDAGDLIPSVRAVGRERAAVPRREGPRHDPVRGAPAGRGDAAVRALGQLRLDGHARRLRDEGDRGLLLRHARSRRTGTRSTRRSTSGSTTRTSSRSSTSTRSWPGHYLQFLYAPRFPTKTRKLVFCGTNAEGWAHYTEQMMVDEGFGGGDPKIRLAQLQEALLRDCRYVVGHQAPHAGDDRGGRREASSSRRDSRSRRTRYEEARRGAYNPTYLYYTLGKLEIQELRDEYRAKTGASLKQFHDAFVAQGGLPIPLVRRILFRAPAARARVDAKGTPVLGRLRRRSRRSARSRTPGTLRRRCSGWERGSTSTGSTASARCSTRSSRTTAAEWGPMPSTASCSRDSSTSRSGRSAG